jgi:hypothetical protein
MRLERFSFGSIRIDDVTYRQDVVIDRGKTRKRRKKPSKPFRELRSHAAVRRAAGDGRRQLSRRWRI